MNGEPNINPQVPVTTLAGIASLTELLPELPLPSSSLSFGDSRSLLFHPRVAEEAQRLLSCRDPALVEQLANSLALTHASHIELKEQYAGPELTVEVKTAPPLLEGILRCNPAVFTSRQGGTGGGPGIKTEGAKVGGPFNHNSSLPKTKHINNVSVIQCGPALVNANQVKVKSEPGGPLSLTALPPVNRPSDQPEVQQADKCVNKPKNQLDKTIGRQKHQGDKSLDNQKQQQDYKSVDSQKQQDEHFSDRQKRQGDKSLSNHLAHAASEKEKEKASQNHPQDTKGKESQDNVNAVVRTMKEPVVVLSKLSSEELESMARIPKVSGVSSNAKADRNADIPSRNSSRRPRGTRETSKYKEVSSGSESEEEDKKKPNKYFKNREREREEKKKKDKADRKRNRIASDEEDYEPDKDTKRRRKGGYQEDEEEEDDDSDYEEPGSESARGNRRSTSATLPKKPSYTNKRIERKLVPQTEKLSAEELMETGVYQRFNRAVEKIFDNTEDLDLNAEIG
ncbi:uncharacterized protein [Panulirus ornatus]|uniref:uncharacterized protein isoform X1 n=1 Tax=Panulirus ornatus TaxID=150431 RepID=UPI003A86875B